MNIGKLFLSLVVAGASCVALFALLSALGDGLRFDDWRRSVPPETPEIQVGTDEPPGKEVPTDAEGRRAPLAILRPRLGGSADAPSGIFPTTVSDRSVQPRDRSAEGRFDSQRSRGDGPGAGHLGREILSGPTPPEGQGLPPQVDATNDQRHTVGSRKSAKGKRRALRRPFRRAHFRSGRSPTRPHGTGAVRHTTSPGHSRPARSARNHGGNGTAKAGGHSGRRGQQ